MITTANGIVWSPIWLLHSIQQVGRQEKSFHMELPFSSTNQVVTTPVSYDLGEHTLTIDQDGTIEIADQVTVTELTPDEVYKLFTVLLTLFPS
jgi:hypothetical protein